jgi:hypothetical protein
MLYRVTKRIYAFAALATALEGEPFYILLRDLRKFTVFSAFPIITSMCFLKESLGLR